MRPFAHIAACVASVLLAPRASAQSEAALLPLELTESSLELRPLLWTPEPAAHQERRASPSEVRSLVVYGALLVGMNAATGPENTQGWSALQRVGTLVLPRDGSPAGRPSYLAGALSMGATVLALGPASHVIAMDGIDPAAKRSLVLTLLGAGLLVGPALQLAELLTGHSPYGVRLVPSISRQRVRHEMGTRVSLAVATRF